MRKHKIRLLIALIIVISVAVTGYVALLYRQGGEGNYTPPPPAAASPREKAQADLQSLARAVEAYFIKNMEYPQRLEQLMPEFIDRVGTDPLSGKAYLYTLNATKGPGSYRLSVPDARLYQAEAFYLEDGTLVQKQL